jgi:hypothetical protein
VNPPADGELFAIPQDSRYDFNEIERERLNAQIVCSSIRPIRSV